MPRTKSTARRIAPIALLLTALAVPAVAQLPKPVQIVAQVLELSEEQLVAFLEIYQSVQEELEPLADEVRGGQELLAVLLEAPAPDPAAVGQQLIAIRALQAEVEEIRGQAIAELEGLLDEAQRQRLEHVRQAEPVCRVLPAFNALQLL